VEVTAQPGGGDGKGGNNDSFAVDDNQDSFEFHGRQSPFLE